MTQTEIVGRGQRANMSHSEELVSAFNVVVYVFDVKPNQWVKKGVARLSIFEDVFSMKYRIVARSAGTPSNVRRAADVC